MGPPNGLGFTDVGEPVLDAGLSNADVSQSDAVSFLSCSLQSLGSLSWGPHSGLLHTRGRMLSLGRTQHHGLRLERLSQLNFHSEGFGGFWMVEPKSLEPELKNT